MNLKQGKIFLSNVFNKFYARNEFPKGIFLNYVIIKLCNLHTNE